mmetsp:Transcript_38942/g.52796  ORF Transcript_38942/g.52796 Transcript_38942/m.52796 type:complete len:175 (-) Transcript_38942:28-552(-)
MTRTLGWQQRELSFELEARIKASRQEAGLMPYFCCSAGKDSTKKSKRLFSFIREATFICDDESWVYVNLMAQRNQNQINLHKECSDIVSSDAMPSFSELPTWHGAGGFSKISQLSQTRFKTQQNLSQPLTGDHHLLLKHKTRRINHAPDRTGDSVGAWSTSHSHPNGLNENFEE